MRVKHLQEHLYTEGMSRLRCCTLDSVSGIIFSASKFYNPVNQFIPSF